MPMLLDSKTASLTARNRTIGALPRLSVNGCPGADNARATANRWELIRTDEGWKCTRRVARLLDSRPEARELLASAAE